MTGRLKEYLAAAQLYTDEGLEKYLPLESALPESIHKSMRYSVFAGGKRIRPAMALAAFELCGGNRENESIRLACCALEMFHAFSLIHDDLPCMDDDDFRRGKPTNHRVFGEAVAVLSGDALCIHAFELLGRTGDCRIIRELATALGTNGMIGGQVVDIESENKSVAAETLEYIHTHKTAALFSASVRIGAMLAGAADKDIDALTAYGWKAGLAFQVADDILDVVGSTRQIGKDAGSDEAKGKATYPSVYGLEKSRKIARALAGEAGQILKSFGERAGILLDTAEYIIARVN